jgi:hypothetical protein
MSARVVFNAMTATLGGLALTLLATPALAAGDSVEIVAHTSFVEPVSPFESTLPGCEDGTVTGGRTAFPPSRGIGVFSGIKDFTCTGGAGGFAIQLSARFGGGPGSAGTWAVQSAWGSMAGLRASGKLVGSGTATGIDDVYTGTRHS